MYCMIVSVCILNQFVSPLRMLCTLAMTRRNPISLWMHWLSQDVACAMRSHMLNGSTLQRVEYIANSHLVNYHTIHWAVMWTCVVLLCFRRVPWRGPVIVATCEAEVVGSIPAGDHCVTVTYVDQVSILSSMSIWVNYASNLSRLYNERRSGPGPKGSRQKSPHGAVVGLHQWVSVVGQPR